jgi:hypothetical protein
MPAIWLVHALQRELGYVIVAVAREPRVAGMHPLRQVFMLWLASIERAM